MIKKLENIFTKFEKPIIKVVILAAVVLFVSLVIFNYRVIVAQYPHEYREGAMVLTTQQLVNHINPYLLSEQPQHTNVYGVLYHLIAYPFASIYGSTLFLHRIISAFFIILSCLWLIFIMRREGVPTWLSLIGGVVYYSQITSLFSVIARPDSLGVFLFMSAVFLPWLGKFKYRYLSLSALCFVLLFYTKLYFVISLPIVALYIFLFKDKLKAIWYFVFSIIFLLISTYIVNQYFPLYLTNTFFYYLSVGNSFWPGLWHVARQFAYFSYKNFALVFIFLIILWDLIIISWAEFFRVIRNYFIEILKSLRTFKAVRFEFDYIVFILLFTTLAFVLKLGHNTGGFVDYIYHLITPFFIIIIFRFLAQKTAKNKFAVYGLLLILWMIFTFFNHRQATDYSASWVAIEDKLSSYQDIFNEPAITSLLVKQNKYIYDTGHSNAYLGDSMSRSPLYLGIVARMNIYNESIINKIINKKFDLVVLDNYGYDLIRRDLLNKYYQPTSTLSAPMIINSWVLELWEPRGDLRNINVK